MKPTTVNLPALVEPALSIEVKVSFFVKKLNVLVAPVAVLFTSLRLSSLH